MSLIIPKIQPFLPGNAIPLDKQFIRLGSRDSIINRLNRWYYAGTNNYRKDFDTISPNPYADAAEFHSHLKFLASSGCLPDRIFSLGWGIGDGIMDAEWLSQLRNLDQKEGTNYFSKVMHILGDFSSAVIANAKCGMLAKLEGTTQFVRLDADCPSFPFRPGTILFIMHKELYDDLPGSDIYRGINQKLTHETWVQGMFNASTQVKTKSGKLIPLDQFREMVASGQGIETLDIGFLKWVGWQEARLPIDPRDLPHAGELDRQCRQTEGEFVLPANWGAADNLIHSLELLDRERGGTIIIYDYGLADLPGYNRVALRGPSYHPLFRLPSGQVTLDVNFALLRQLAEKVGASALIEEARPFFEMVPSSESNFPGYGAIRMKVTH